MYTVVYACNDFYAKLAGISLQSLLETNKDDFACYILCDNVSSQNINKLKSIQNKYSNLCNINFINANEILKDLKTFMNGYDNALDKNMGGGVHYLY